ncbi:hypothetical protein [Methylomonas albis]|uniref:Uncharacterized protein n=1 Tax=Methylomonas albis TaxID=1854563 RepID=A0ABR9CVW0_9GAMM|nr:hypothetical protein [Methylomonas albis]MBD9354987.1 hypothetical protein [Methylomonas albis]
MAELLFIATTIFVAYVVFVVMGGKKEKPETSKPEPAKPELTKPAVQMEQAPPPLAAVKTSAKPAPAKTATPKPAVSKASKSAPTKKAVAATPSTAVESLKNPNTGEVAKIPASYAFAKRWIKDALVEEGLLEKVYKNNELDDAANAKIQTALQQLKGMSKYQ